MRTQSDEVGDEKTTNFSTRAAITLCLQWHLPLLDRSLQNTACLACCIQRIWRPWVTSRHVHPFRWGQRGGLSKPGGLCSFVNAQDDEADARGNTITYQCSRLMEPFNNIFSALAQSQCMTLFIEGNNEQQCIPLCCSC